MKIDGIGKCGTPFQRDVWRALLLIPEGRVTTYGEIARFLGRPGAVRAVGTAVGKNPAAPEIPCHRVVRADGRIGGYSGDGGVGRKIALLKKEGVDTAEGKIAGFAEKLYRFEAQQVISPSGS